MGKALSQDLLWVIVEKRLFYGDTLEKIAADTLQPLSTVGRVLARVSSRQSLQTWQGVRAGLPGNAKLDPIHRDRLLEVVLTVDADYSLEEIANLFSSAYGLQLSVPDMSRAMLEMNHTHKSVRRSPRSPVAPTHSHSSPFGSCRRLPTIAMLSVLSSSSTT